MWSNPKMQIYPDITFHYDSNSTRYNSKPGPINWTQKCEVCLIFEEFKPSKDPSFHSSAQ